MLAAISRCLLRKHFKVNEQPFGLSAGMPPVQLPVVCLRQNDSRRHCEDTEAQHWPGVTLRHSPELV